MSTMLDVPDISELDREALVEHSKTQVQADKQCRIMLHESVTTALPLLWNVGGKHGRDTVITVEPGTRGVVQPLAKAQAWFGPFTVPLEYKGADERRKDKLRKFWAEEKKRALDRYDYPRPLSVGKDGLNPVGPHRFPNVIVEIIEDDGSTSGQISLHKLYKIGAYDETYPLDSFGQKESVEAVKARYEGELAETAASHERDMAALRAQIAELGGLVKGRLFSLDAKE
jgi:hypothetical protein